MEKKFKNIEKIIDFLKVQSEIISARKESEKDKWGNCVVKVKLDPNTHSVRKTFLSHYLNERIKGNLRVSIIEVKN